MKLGSVYERQMKIKKIPCRYLMFFICGVIIVLLGDVIVHPSGAFIQGDDEKTGEVDRAQALTIDSRGNVYVTGYSYEKGSDYDFTTLKYDFAGNQIWMAKYNGPGNGSDYASAVAVDSDGNVYVAGHSNGAGTSLDLTVISYDQEGEERWVARYDGPSHRDDYAQALAIDDGNNLLVTGYSFGQGTEHDYITLKFTSTGIQLWAARYNPPRNRDDSAIALALDKYGNVFVTGTDRVRSTSYDFATIKYDPSGKQLWLARFHGHGANFDSTKALAVDAEGYIYVSGLSDDSENGYDIVTVKYDSLGNQVWAVRFNGSADRIDTPSSLTVDKHGNVYVSGRSIGENTASDYCLLKYNKNGNLIWVTIYNGPGNGADTALCLALDHDSNLVVTGHSWGDGTERDFATLKYDPDGKMLWEVRYNGSSNGEDVPRSLAVGPEDNIYVTGYSFGEKTAYDYVTVKYDSEGNQLWVARYPNLKNK